MLVALVVHEDASEDFQHLVQDVTEGTMLLRCRLLLRGERVNSLRAVKVLAKVLAKQAHLLEDRVVDIGVLQLIRRVNIPVIL